MRKIGKLRKKTVIRHKGVLQNCMERGHLGRIVAGETPALRVLSGVLRKYCIADGYYAMLSEGI